MFRKMLATTAVVALMTAPAMAADAKSDMSKDMEASSAAKTENASTSSNVDLSKDDMLASNFIGKTIYTSANDDAEAIGDVEDVVLSQDGNVDAVIVSVGGFLGIGDKEVALPFDRLSMEQKDGEEWIVADTSSEELNQMQEFDAAMLEPDQQQESQQADASDQEMTSADDSAEQAAMETEQETEQAANEAEQETEQAANEAEQETEQAANEAEQETEQAANEADQQTDQAAMETDQAAADNQTEGQTMAATPAAGETNADGSAVSNEQTASTQPGVRDGMQPADQAAISAEDLIGTTVYGANDESLGEIGDVILGEDKGIEAYIIDVGGFLGIGEKPVAISPSAVELMKQAQSDDYAVFTKYSEEQLDNQAEYSKDEYEQNRDSILMK